LTVWVVFLPTDEQNIFLLPTILILGCFASVATAQPGTNGGGTQPLTASANAPIYRISKAGEITIPINLWGYVGGPGHYDVPSSTTLIDLISYAGGPQAQARLVDIRIIHADTSFGERRVEVFNLEAYRDYGDLSQNPLLVPGDTIIVSGRALDVFFQAVSVVTNIMVIVTALINFISFTAK